jgi:hypothetical protein
MPDDKDVDKREDTPTDPQSPGALRVAVMLLASDMTRVTDATIPKPKLGMPDVVIWNRRVFARERIHDPGGARRWGYVEVSTSEAT